jgi:hypothetical protein
MSTVEVFQTLKVSVNVTKWKVLALPALALAAGLGAAAAGEPRELRGHYTVRWEEQSFTPCGQREKWWVADPGPLMGRYREVLNGGDYGTVYVRVRAEVTDRGMFGHMGMYPRAVAIREVVLAREAGSDDCRGRDVEVE